MGMGENCSGREGGCLIFHFGFVKHYLISRAPCTVNSFYIYDVTLKLQYGTFSNVEICEMFQNVFYCDKAVC